MAVRNGLTAPATADLYATIITDKVLLVLLGDTAIADQGMKFWYYDASSMATDNGTTVIKPTSVNPANPGRYLICTNAPTAAVANTGAYSDLSGKPTLATVATSGAYADLTGKPSLATVATSGSYADLTGKPSLSTVATSGLYSDLTGNPTVSPIGSIIMYGGTSAPTGYLLCDGTAVSRTTYSTLFAITSTSFGVGDNSTTFNLPDLRQRFPLGKAASGTGSTLGGTGGTIDHLHTIDPASTATSSDGSHNHTGVTGTPSATAQATALGPAVASGTHTHTISSDGAHTHTVDIAVFNSGTANPPFQAVNYIIKYLA